MAADMDQLAPGLVVYTSDGIEVGEVKRIWWPNGKVEPPETDLQQGTFTVEDTDRGAKPQSGYFQVARPLAPDWYIPFAEIRDVFAERVVLRATHAEALRFPWQEKPE